MIFIHEKTKRNVKNDFIFSHSLLGKILSIMYMLWIIMYSIKSGYITVADKLLIFFGKADTLTYRFLFSQYLFYRFFAESYPFIQIFPCNIQRGIEINHVSHGAQDKTSGHRFSENMPADTF